MLFPDSNLSSFWPIFFRLCMDIYIREDWFGIANRLNSVVNYRVVALDWCKNVFFLNIFKTNGWVLIKFCICIDKYLIHIVSNAHYFWSILTDLRPLISVRILVLLIILWINLWISIKFCIHWYWQDADLDDWTIFFVHFQKSYGSWLMLKFRLCSISCGPIWILIKFCKCIDIDKM